MALRLVFMGTPDFAVPTLNAIVGHGHDVAAVYTRAPKPAGRGMDVTPSPVEREARRAGLPVLTPATLRTPDTEARSCAPTAPRRRSWLLTGSSLPQAILDVFPLGAFNLHASLLPRWRGAAPINRAIMAGDRESGVTVMRMAAGLDTGDIAMDGEVPLIERLPIGPDMTAGDLHDELARLGAGLMARALGALERSSLKFTPQPAEGVTYAAKIAKAETRIDWSLPWNRGARPYPGTVAVSGRLVRDARRKGASTDQGAAQHPGRG